MKRILTIFLCLAVVATMFTSCAIPTKSLTAAELLDLGEKYLLEMDYEKALVQFLKVIEIEPMNPRGYTGAAEAYIALGRTNEAIAILQRGFEHTGDGEIKTRLDELQAEAPAESATTAEPTEVLEVTTPELTLESTSESTTDTLTTQPPTQTPPTEIPQEQSIIKMDTRLGIDDIKNFGIWPGMTIFDIVDKFGLPKNCSSIDKVKEFVDSSRIPEWTNSTITLVFFDSTTWVTNGMHINLEAVQLPLSLSKGITLAEVFDTLSIDPIAKGLADVKNINEFLVYCSNNKINTSKYSDADAASVRFTNARLTFFDRTSYEKDLHWTFVLYFDSGEMLLHFSDLHDDKKLYEVNIWWR